METTEKTIWINLPEDEKLTILSNIAEEKGIKENAVEKDFWVSMVLKAMFSRISFERKEEIRKFTFECVYYGLMDELEDEGKKKDLGFLLNRAIDYLDEIGLTPAEKFKAEISDTLQRMIEKEKE